MSYLASLKQKYEPHVQPAEVKPTLRAFLKRLKHVGGDYLIKNRDILQGILKDELKEFFSTYGASQELNDITDKIVDACSKLSEYEEKGSIHTVRLVEMRLAPTINEFNLEFFHSPVHDTIEYL